jgi:acetyl esterase/lipase
MWLGGCTALQLSVANAPARFADIKRTVDIGYGEKPRQRLDVFQPAAAAGAAPVIIFWYGGGFTSGNRSQYRFACTALAQQGFICVLPDYRLYPEVRFPEFMDDAALAAAWVQQHIGSYGGDANNLILMGHSAGAYMASLLVADEKYLARVQADPGNITGLIGLSGPYDLVPDTPVLNRIFAPPLTTADWQPYKKQRRAAPPTLLIHGADDARVRARVSEVYAARLRELGSDVTLKIYEHCDHACPLAALSVPARKRAATLADVTSFVRAVSARRRVSRPSG